MFKSYKYRLYPTEIQKELIKKHIGSCRFIYNLALETKITAYTGNKINLSAFDLMKQLPELKKECPWLKEINAQSLQTSLVNLDTAYKNFFKGQGNFPKFKKKSEKGSFTIPQYIKIENNKINILKFKEGIKFKYSRPIKGKIKRATISKTPTDKYFVSILTNTEESSSKKKPIKEKTTIGIDLGIKSFLVSSDSKEYKNPKYLKKHLSKLKYLQRKYSKYKGKRTKKKLAKEYEKVINKRKDFLHKTSTELVKNHDSLAIEDLNINDMLQNHKLAQSISDVAWSSFIRMLEYKCEWYGKNLLKIGRFEPSSKMCYKCGYINKELKLSDRKWVCPNCHSEIDRDFGAAINIKNFALKNYVSGMDTKTHDELPTLVGVMTHETHNE